jgi:hypothetical protein
MFYGISVLIIGYNAICFYNAGKAYKEAGSIVKNTMYQLSTTAYAGCVELNNVPETWKGIPIFRLGFIDGIKWILGDGTAEKITFKSFLKTSPAFPVLQFHAINKSDPSICISGDFVPTK